jgi:hypothetical protein
LEERIMRQPLCAFLSIVAAVVVATGCAQPSYTYVTNGDDHVYFKVPRTWQRIDQGQLEAVATIGLTASEAAALRAATWSRAYDADPNPSVTHLLGSTAQQPIALSRVLHVPESARSSVTADALRNLFLPITEQARAAAAATSGTLFPKPDIRTNKRVKIDGLTGIHLVFRLSVGSSVDTFDQTAYKSRDGSKVYLLVLRCAQTCYSHRYGGELVDVVRSFTVESAS